MTDFNKEEKQRENAYRQKIYKAKSELMKRIPKRLKRKPELWEQDKTPLQITIINAKLRFAKFNRETHGMGFLMILLLGGLIILTIVDKVGDAIVLGINKDKYKDALSLSCPDIDFYAWNFRACEEIGVRPLPAQPVAPTPPSDTPKGDNV